MTRAAVAACPVAAIKIESSYATKQRNNRTNDIETTNHTIWTVQQMTSKTNQRPFPRPFSLYNDTDVDASNPVPNVYWIGHHNEHSFGAIPYLVQSMHNGKHVWIMIDVPKFTIQSIKDVISITGSNGPHYMFLTHIDDTADHLQWSNYFNSTTSNYCQRIIHSADLGPNNWLRHTTLEHVPILLKEPKTSLSPLSPLTPLTPLTSLLNAYTLDGQYIDNPNWIEEFESGILMNNTTDVVIIHTPGHSPGSCRLYKRRSTSTMITTTFTGTTTTSTMTLPGILFTGDTYAYSSRTKRMTGFPRYSNNIPLLNTTLHTLISKLNQWDIIAPGHGLSRDYRQFYRDNTTKYKELKEAQNDLFLYSKRY